MAASGLITPPLHESTLCDNLHLQVNSTSEQIRGTYTNPYLSIGLPMQVRSLKDAGAGESPLFFNRRAGRERGGDRSAIHRGGKSGAVGAGGGAPAKIDGER